MFIWPFWSCFYVNNYHVINNTQKLIHLFRNTFRMLSTSITHATSYSKPLGYNINYINPPFSLSSRNLALALIQIPTSHKVCYKFPQSEVEIYKKMLNDLLPFLLMGNENARLFWVIDYTPIIFYCVCGWSWTKCYF